MSNALRELLKIEDVFGLSECRFHNGRPFLFCDQDVLVEILYIVEGDHATLVPIEEVEYHPQLDGISIDLFSHCRRQELVIRDFPVLRGVDDLKILAYILQSAVQVYATLLEQVAQLCQTEMAVVVLVVGFEYLAWVVNLAGVKLGGKVGKCQYFQLGTAFEIFHN